VSRNLIFIQIFAGHVIFRHLVGMNFLFVVISRVFHTRYDVSFEGVSFFNQLLDAL